MKVDREKALAMYGPGSGLIAGHWHAKGIISIVLDVLETQSHLWERGDDGNASMHGPALFAANQRIAELESENKRSLEHVTLLRNYIEASEAEGAKLRAEIEDLERKLREAFDEEVMSGHSMLQEIKAANTRAAKAEAECVVQSNIALAATDAGIALKIRADTAEAEVAKLRAELERCSKACDEAKRKADDHRRQRDELERKSAEDAALIKSLQEQLAETKEDLAGAKEYAERTAESCRKFLAERDEALGKLDKLRVVLAPGISVQESFLCYAHRMRSEAMEILGGKP